MNGESEKLNHHDTRISCIIFEYSRENMKEVKYG